MTLRPHDRLESVDSSQLLAPTRLTGIVNTAPWHELSEALLIATLLVSVNVWVVPAGTTHEPAVLVNVTPVEASQADPLSEVMDPLPLLMAVTVTW